MKIAVAADHGGFEFKKQLVAQLRSEGHEVEDFGPQSLDPCDDYPDYGIPAAAAVGSGAADRAILICNNGIGMSILGNKVPGVRSALVYSEKTARETRMHHDSNVLCLAGQEFPPDALLRMARTWLATGFESGGRHERRMRKITGLDASR